MAKTLNLNKSKKSFLTISFLDGNQIFVTMPTKKIYDEILAVSESADETDNLSQIFSVLSMALSKNMSDKQITKEYLEENLDIEDVVLIFKAYVDFVSENSNQKN